MYWNQPIMIGLLASLLDLQLKTLSNWNKEIQNSIKEELRCQFKELIDSNSASSPFDSLNQPNMHPYHNRLHSSIFDVITANLNPFSELDYYLDPTYTPVAEYDINPFEWWLIRKTQFPNVVKLTRKYLSIPASSVLSKRLFSDAGNQITAKRTHLDLILAGKMMFMKRNSNVISIF